MDRPSPRARGALRRVVAAQPEPDGFRHVRHLYVLRVRDREAFRAGLADRGIETLVHYPRPIHRIPRMRAWRTRASSESERHAAECVSLPLYPELRDDEADAVVAALA